MQQPGFRGAFYKADGQGGWRAPAVNETCCVRTNLADLLDAIGAQGPDALYLRHGNDLASEIQAAGGIVTAEDLQSAAAVLKDPLVIRVCPVPHSSCKTPILRQRLFPGRSSMILNSTLIASWQLPAAMVQQRLQSVSRENQSCSGLGVVSPESCELAVPIQDKSLRMLCRLEGCRCWCRHLPVAEQLRWQASR